jgi:hypothetical protein
VIVRIATEDQFELPEDLLKQVNDLDNAVVDAVQAGDEAKFRELFDELLALVRNGTKLGDDDLRESQVILPPSDVSLEEAKRDFSGEGVIPDSVLPGSG